jgi:hypothetical protein
VRQHQEGCLEGVLGLVLVAQQAPAHAENHRPVATDQRREGGLVPARQEACQQLGVGQRRVEG